jgi:phosphohistidine phosphatase SixA
MFRHLVLIRHATAEERSWSKDDFARALTEKGHFQAKTLAALSDAAGVPAPDVVFSSGYRRAEETLRHFFNPDNVCLVRDATFAPEGGMKRTVQALFQGLERFEVGPQACTWVFGHNPHLESLLDAWLLLEPSRRGVCFGSNGRAASSGGEKSPACEWLFPNPA